MTQAFYADHISAHLGETPEGFLVCLGARLARSGYQTYHGSELGLNTDDDVDCYRSPDQVLDEAFIASLNGKPVTDQHPRQFVNSSNASWYVKGHVQHPRAGGRLDDGNVTVIGDLLITDPGLIERIRSGAVRELSVGYDFHLRNTGDGYEQCHLRANHVAVVPKGRAGSEIKIMDATHLPKNFADIVQRFLGQHAIAVKRETDQRTCDAREEEPKMTKTKLKQLRSLLDELLEERQEQFARDTGIEVDSDAYARLARGYLGKPLPLLGETRDESEPAPDRRRVKAARDSRDVAAEFERDCRRLRLELQNKRY
jgi:hypothetical protein